MLSSLTKVVRAQDTLVLQDSKELYVKVIEIGDDKIFYRKTDNLNGPLYSCAKREVFMALYRGGRREIFDTPLQNQPSRNNSEKSPSAPDAAMTDENFRLVLKKLVKPRIRKNYETVTGDVDVFTGNDFFATISFVAVQKNNAQLDFSHPRPAHAAKRGISLQITSTQLGNYLFEKYENTAGSGLGWVLPDGFLSGDVIAPCEVAYLKKPRQTETDVAWLQGKLDFEKYHLKSCGSLEEKMLSITLQWLKKNFSSQQ
ncbi:MAG TPA: hypothetical protein VL307_08890 [Chitinophagaceae bacterium]|nr:hypothetical protein [Chitinophagaceae bacterium]